jgi:hypothetical protein
MAVVAYSFCEPLPLSDPAYDELVKQVRATYPRACITMIDRINNAPLTQNYEDKKLELAAKGAPVTEYTVYHGTAERNVESICRSGFLPSKGRVMALGFGIYFAKNFSYSHAYAPPADEFLADKQSYIFVCKILPGRIAPALANQYPPYGMDSRADSTEKPSIFAIPDPHQMLPVYLVRFAKEAETPLALTPEAVPLTEDRVLTDKEARRLMNSLGAKVRQIENRQKQKKTKNDVIIPRPN